MAKSRGVRGAAGACAAASLVYLLGRSLLALLVSALMGLAHPGASLAKPLGFSDVSAALFQLLVGIGAIALTLAFLLKLTRLRQVDLRIALPAPWSPGFCLPVFLGVANLANLAGALINHITDNPTTSELLPSGGPELLVCFITLCIMPAVAEELLFRGAFQGLMRPCGSAAAIFAPALLFGLLHLDLAQGLTAFACGVFLGWLTERSGSILPGMLLHLVNNTLAFLTIYLRYYAPAELSFGVELFILLFFPVFGGWMIWNARQQGFRFSAGLRPGVEDLSEMGHEFRLGFCIGDDPDHSPWPPLHTDYGFAPEDSAVTMFWPQEHRIHAGHSVPEFLEWLCEIAPYGWDPGMAIIFTPKCAEMFAREGWTKQRVLNYVAEYARLPASKVDLQWLTGNSHRPKNVELPEVMTHSTRIFWSTEHMFALVGGGQAGQMMTVLAGGGDHGGPSCTKIELPENWAELVREYQDLIPEYIPY